MKNNLTMKSVIIALTAITLAACSSSNEVASGRVITKRKHNKGFHINWPQNWKSENSSNENVATTEGIRKHETAVVEEKTTTATIKTADEVIATTNDAVVMDAITTSVEETSNPEVKEAVQKEKRNLKPAMKQTQASSKEQRAEMKQMRKELRKAAKNEKRGGDVPVVVLYILCFVLPPLAVGLATDWDTKPLIWNIVWCILCGFPGVIHAIIHVSRNT